MYSKPFCLAALLFTLCSLVSQTVSFAQSPSEGKFEKLIWSDEFNGNKLDYSKWECEVNAFGGGNNELQLYTDRKENVRVENGILIIEAHKENANIAGTVRDYSSGRVRTKNRGDWTYGRFEVKAKLPKGPGIWPAIWMLPTEDKYGTWARNGEIDIMEFKGQEPNRIHCTLHFGDTWPNNRFSTKVHERKDFDFSTDFHTYGIQWRKEKMEWLIDDQIVASMTQWDSKGFPYPAPFDQPFHLILNIAIGGGFGGNVSPSTPFPARFEIDSVKVYQ